MSTATASTDTEWYDAPDAMEDGPHEFVVASGDSPDDQPSEIRTNDSQSTLESDSESDDTDFEDNDSPETDPKQQQPLASVQRRTSLPAPQPADEGSLFSVLKKNVGKVRRPVRVSHCILNDKRPIGSLHHLLPRYLQ